ncbi:hypothetical protein SOP94_19580 [Peribacillus frigoritolerans]|uniref:hypothetical protein n=1 Tax=Peribacillus frigoritolerans TaxID=450367 RepID=UPI002B24C8C2|nr:hypothetical protein [Peribacillus frigoritolerans]MEB2630660.1 hypothetical protein [Peribacillus frigoritolerans]
MMTMKLEIASTIKTLNNPGRLWDLMWKEEYHRVFNITLKGENFSSEERNSTLKVLNEIHSNIDDIMNELKYIYGTIFQYTLNEHSYEEIVQLLPDYKRENSPCVKKIIDQNSFYSVWFTYLKRHKSS